MKLTPMYTYKWLDFFSNFMNVYPTVPKLVTVREIDLRQRRTSIVQEKEHRIHLYMKVSLVMDH